MPDACEFTTVKPLSRLPDMEILGKKKKKTHNIGAAAVHFFFFTF